MVTVALNGMATQALSEAPGFGTDPRLYYLFELSNGFRVAGRSTSIGEFSEVLTPNVDYTLTVYQASTNLSALYSGHTNASGEVTDVGTIIVDEFGGPDSDQDGLPDVGELAIGTSGTLVDTDRDGINDAAEITQGLDPLDDRGFPTGIISSLPLMGPANAVAVAAGVTTGVGQTAYVATGEHGLAIVNVTQFNNPIVLGQLDLPGTATDVAIDPALQLAAVAANEGGLHIVNVADPELPTLARTINITASTVETAGGIAYVVAGSELRTYDLANGSWLNTLSLGSSITGLAREGKHLFVMGSDELLQAIEINGYSLIPRGSLALDDGGGRIFVGNGIVYALAGNAQFGGFSTVNVSNPNQLTLISGVDVTPPFGRSKTDFAANGSGVGVLVGAPGPGVQLVEVMNIADLTKTDEFLVRVDLPQAPVSLTLAGGIAYVANGTGGLQVVNYLPFDNRGQAPTVNASTSATDLNPALAGLQLAVGTSIPIQVSVADDVQIRNVELLVNGVVVQNSLSFPFDFSTVLPSLSEGSSLVEIVARATDTGGNQTTSAPLLVQVVSDIYPPLLLDANPRQGSVRGQSWRTATFTFSEPLDAATVTAGTFLLIGPSGEISPEKIELRGNGTVVQLTYPPAAVGAYELVIDAAAVKDLAGNLLGAGNISTTFQLAQFSAIWSNPVGGFWDEPQNWSGGVTPGADDDVLIDLSSGSEVTFRSGTAQVNRLSLANPFRITGGRLAAATIETSSTFSLQGGTIASARLIAATGGSYSISDYDAVLDGVRLDVDLDVDQGNQLTIHNGLVVNGRLTVGKGDYGYLILEGTQTLSGTGQIELGSPATQGYVYAYGPGFSNVPVTVTLTPGLTLRGAGRIHGSSAARLVNQGVLAADVSGQVLRVNTALTNSGQLRVENGATLELYGAISLGDIAGAEISNGHLRLLGAIDNVGQTIFLDRLPAFLSLEQATILGGSVTTSTGAPFVLPQGWNLALDGVQLSAGITIGEGATLSLAGAWANTAPVAVGGGTLNLGGTFSTSQLSTLTRSGGTVNVTGTLNNVGQTLTLNASTGSWNLQGGTIVGGTITSTGGASLTASDGTLDGTVLNADMQVRNGELTIRNGLTVNGMLTVGESSFGYLYLLGTQTISGGGQIVLGDANGEGYLYIYGPNFSSTASTVTLAPGLAVRGTGEIYGSSSEHRLINQGVIAADVSGKELAIYSALTNAGRLEVKNEAILRLAGTVSLPDLAGLFVTSGTVQLSGRLDNTGQTLNLDQLPTSWSLQQFTIGGGIVTTSTGAAFVLPDSWNLALDGATVASALTVGDGETLSLAGAWVNNVALNVAGGTLNYGGTFSTSQLGTLTRSGGTVNVTGTLNNVGQTLTLNASTGSWNLQGGTINGGTITAADGASLVLPNGSSGVLDGVTLGSDLILRNSVTLTIRNGLTLAGSTLSAAPANDTSGYITIYFDGTQTLGGTGTLVLGYNNFGYYGQAYGSATLTVGSGITVRGAGYLFPTGLINQGTISGNSPAFPLYVQPSTFTNKGTIEATSGGTLNVSTFSPNTGLVLARPGSIVSISGSFINSINGSVLVQVGGTSAAQFGRIQVSGSAALDGSFEIALVNSFVPTVGNSFEVLTFTSRTGDFSTINGLSLPNGLVVNRTFSGTAMTLTAAAPLLAAVSSTTLLADELSEADVLAVHEEAIGLWIALGLPQSIVDRLGSVSIATADMPDNLLALWDGSTITFDRDAAGHGWFVDPTAGEDEEFSATDSDDLLLALSDSAAEGRMDLLTALLHEQGHILGLDHVLNDYDGHLLSADLDAGVRRKLDTSILDELLASDAWRN